MTEISMVNQLIWEEAAHNRVLLHSIRALLRQAELLLLILCFHLPNKLLLYSNNNYLFKIYHPTIVCCRVIC